MSTEMKLIHARRRWFKARRELESVTVFIRGTLDRVDQALVDDQRHVINPLGELQRTAQDYDRLCTEIGVWSEVIKLLEEEE